MIEKVERRHENKVIENNVLHIVASIRISHQIVKFKLFIVDQLVVISI